MLKFTTFIELFENEGLKKKAAKSGISLEIGRAHV